MLDLYPTRGELKEMKDDNNNNEKKFFEINGSKIITSLHTMSLNNNNEAIIKHLITFHSMCMCIFCN